MSKRHNASVFPEKLYFPRASNYKQDDDPDQSRMVYETKIGALRWHHTEWVAEYQLVRVRKYRYRMEEVK